jgi:hypothetical protein
MTVNKASLVGSLLGIAIAMTGLPSGLGSQQNHVQPATTPAIDNDDIGGVVTSRFGPEAGVWVIAETTDFGTRFAKIAVTDERGRYVVPDWPHAHYRIWVRGYGLVDSPKVDTEPGKGLDLTAGGGPEHCRGGAVLPGGLLVFNDQDPRPQRVPRHRRQSSGIPENFKTQEQWLNFIKTNGCGNCHQMGNYATRTISEKLGKFEPSQHAWPRRSLEP